MPIQLNLLERIAFHTLNAAPAPMLDLAGALAYQALSAAVHLDVFTHLRERPSTPVELAQTLGTHERGTRHLLEALATIGYVAEQNGRYHNTAMTEKWFLDGTMLDMNAAVMCWDVFLHELWPHAPEIVRSGKRPFDFYEFTARDPSLNHAHQHMMMGNANIVGPDIVKKVALPETANRLLDVGGGHGKFTVYFCQAYSHLTATIMDSEIALEIARETLEAAQLSDRVDLHAADLWQVAWGTKWDIILLFNLLHHYDLDTNRMLLRKTYDALKPGGQVAIFDQVEGSVYGSASNALVRLVALMYYLFADGRAFTRDELTAVLTDTGFSNIRFYPLRQVPGSSLFVAGR